MGGSQQVLRVEAGGGGECQVAHSGGEEFSIPGSKKRKGSRRAGS